MAICCSSKIDLGGLYRRLWRKKNIVFCVLRWHDNGGVQGYDYQQKSDVAIAVYKIYINFAPTKRENAGPIAQLVRAADS